MQRFDCIRVVPGRWEPPPCFPLRDRWGDFWAVRYCRCEFWKLRFWALRISGFQGFLKSPAKSTSFGGLSVFDMWVTRLGGSRPLRPTGQGPWGQSVATRTKDGHAGQCVDGGMVDVAPFRRCTPLFRGPTALPTPLPVVYRGSYSICC